MSILDSVLNTNVTGLDNYVVLKLDPPTVGVGGYYVPAIG